MAGENAIAETRRESLDLAVDSIGDVQLAIEWNMAISPERMLTVRRACFIEQTLLRHQHERAFRDFSV